MTRFEPDWCIHPGEHWREAIEEAGLSQSEVARAVGCSQQYLNNILNGHRLPKVELTIAFANYLNLSPQLLWRLRADYELDLALGKKRL